LLLCLISCGDGICGNSDDGCGDGCDGSCGDGCGDDSCDGSCDGSCGVSRRQMRDWQQMDLLQKSLLLLQQPDY
ncbi:MAG: hypothetical protein M3Y53_10735, partial [Thermoproteota archaeon]|nr:hypothetical protein [Thermoproteota archaeon]